MTATSQDQLFSCKWAWCRSTFPNNTGLVHHVVHDHVRRAIPVRRRDISMIRRAEEGQGESKSVEPPQEPSSSLPSPPASSPALHSPHHLDRSPPPVPSPSPLSLEHREKHILIKPRSPDDILRQTLPHLTSSQPLHGQSPPATQTFASLSSPEPERPPFSFEMPDSPSFSFLVERSNKLKMTPNIADSMMRNKNRAIQLQPPSPPHPSFISFDSQNSVEVQLTQTEQDDDEIGQDEDLDLRYHSSNGLLSQAPDIPIPSSELIHEHDDCGEDLRWEPSQPAEEYLTSDPTSQSQSNSHHHLKNLPVMSQPPSQLRLDSEFPLHFHDRPRGSTSKAPHTAHTVLDPSAVMPFSPPSPVSTPTFAVSTPARQNWYQPPLKRRKKSTCNDKTSDPFSSKVEGSVSPKKMFRSGTLQITPASLSEESRAKPVTVDAALPMDIDSDANRQNNLEISHSPYDLDIFSQSSQDSSDLYEINSYPALQTQAPYQSQSSTEF